MTSGGVAGWWSVLRRELAGYFATPVALVFIVIFLVLAGVFTFELGGYYTQYRQADLRPFFDFHPWLYLFLVPAVGMRVWAEERKQGTIELLLTLPIATAGAVVGKFLASWIFVGLALALTFPMWMTVDFLGEPDHGAIATAYAGSFLMAGGFLGIAGVLSACTKSQVVAFIVSVVVCLLMLLAGLNPVLNFVKSWAPQAAVESVAGLSFLTRYENFAKGVIDVRDVVYFVSLIGVCLALTTLVLNARKGE